VQGAYIVVKIQDYSLCCEVKLMEIAKLLWNSSSPEKIELFQTTKMPLEAPLEGMKRNLYRVGGQKFLMYCESKTSLFVSCRQQMSLLLSEILFLMEFHLVSELIPLTFQHSIF
jgi:hypothetical protein